MIRRRKRRGNWTIRLLFLVAIALGVWWIAFRGGPPVGSEAADPAPPAGAAGAAGAAAQPAASGGTATGAAAAPADPAARAWPRETAPRAPDPARAAADEVRNRAAPVEARPAEPRRPEPARNPPPAPTPERVAAPEPVAPPERPKPAPVAEERRPAPAASDASLTVLDLSTAAAIDRAAREPSGVATTFAAGGGRAIWAYAVLRNDSELERTLTFVWKQGGTERTRSELKVAPKAARWRTWSKKNLPPTGAAGHWSVELLDESGLPLASRTFEVEP
jgi:hypothetical protein